MSEKINVWNAFTQHTAIFTIVFCFMGLSSCSTTSLTRNGNQPVDKNVPAINCSIICIIHGDGDYLYHDAEGYEFQADERALRKAQKIALLNPGTEVFIFHQKARKYSLLFFPRHDGEFYYYTNGQLVANEQYWRDQGSSRFDPEAGLYGRFRAEHQGNAPNLLFYFGHEIPEYVSTGYDASSPERSFTVHDLADGVRGFTKYVPKFDLIVLAACFSGTPYTIGTLAPFAQRIIASPDNLHLSYFDLIPMENVVPGIENANMKLFAKDFARNSFDRLTAAVQTAVSFAVYDGDSVQEYAASVLGTYEHSLMEMNGKTEQSTNPVVRFEHCDCATVPGFVLPSMNTGVDVLYRPARFGRSKNTPSHSGWECWREKGTLQAIYHEGSQRTQ